MEDTLRKMQQLRDHYLDELHKHEKGTAQYAFWNGLAGGMQISIGLVMDEMEGENV